jgi:uncharacterized membrane protein (UPF0136 family)
LPALNKPVLKEGKMSAKTGQVLIFYGVFLMLAGAAGFLSNPEKAKTALISGGTFGLLSIFWGWLGLRRIPWSLIAARISTAFLAVVFTWRAAVTWGKVLQGTSEKTFAALLISAMLAASVTTLIFLFRRQK